MYGNAYEVDLLEASDRVGGNCLSKELQYGGTNYSIDCGAQFFFKNPQPSYTALLQQLGLLDNATDIISAPAGFTIYDIGRERASRGSGSRRRFRSFSNTRRPIGSGSGSSSSTSPIRRRSISVPQPNWELSIDDWFKTLTLLDSDFKENVLKPFLYQFVSLPLNRIGESSAVYGITYFVRNLLGAPGVSGSTTSTPPALPALPTFTTYQSMIGLDGIHLKVLEAAQIVPKLNSPVTKITYQGKLKEVTTPSGTIAAEYVVFATDPHAAAQILRAGGATDPALIQTLLGFEYVNLPISMQKDGSCWMPPTSSHWEPVNTLVNGQSVTFSAWFGPLRPTYGLFKQIPVFKSWAAPDVGTCQYEFFRHSHFIPLPTTSFMKTRAQLQPYQGKNGVWYAGGWTTWFDSQEAALLSATTAASGIPGVPARRMTGEARLVRPDPATIDQNLRDLIERIAQVAPDDQKQRLLDTIERVETQGWTQTRLTQTRLTQTRLISDRVDIQGGRRSSRG